ncbi:MAG: DoxX family protein [Alphaproteobacteria bacterium]
MITIKAARKIDTLIGPLRRFSNCVLSPLLDLGIRVFAANIFFWSGKSKFENYLNNDWDSTLYLFREAHVVPFLPVEVAAVLGTATELILPVLLVLGLFTRAAALGLLLTTILIQFFVADEFGDGLSNPDHYLWMLLLAVPLIKGPGKLSLDALILKWIR